MQEFMPKVLFLEMRSRSSGLGFQSGVRPLDALVTFRASLDATLRNLADEAVQLYALALSRAADDKCGLPHHPLEAFGLPGPNPEEVG